MAANRAGSFDVVVVGSGSAGSPAAIAAARAGAGTALLFDIHQHRQAMWDKDTHDADRALWSVLDEERL